MSLPPEYVPMIQNIASHARSIQRQCEELLKEIGAPHETVCRVCGGKGVFDADFGSAPCRCPKGAPFRAAAAAQRAKSGREAAAGRDG